MSKWTVAEITKICQECSDKVGDTFNCPVILNGRLTRTLGKVTHSKNCEGIWQPQKLEMSKQLLETSSDESIISVIQHEWCHYYVTKSTGEEHGHDKVFKAMCAKIGCKNDGTHTAVERTVSASQVYKYQVYCPTCDEFICNRSRRVEWMNRINECKCTKCKGGNLVLMQNW